MNSLFVDSIEDFVDSLDYSLEVKTISYDVSGDTTTVTFCDTLYLRDNMNILINSVDTELLTFDVDTKTITLSTEYTINDSFSLIKPLFLHGTPYAINTQLDKTKVLTTPIVYFLEILRENVPSNLDSRFSSVSSGLRLAFLDGLDKKNFTTDLSYIQCVKPQRKFADFFLKKIKRNKYFGIPENISMTNYAVWGQYATDKGSINSIFNKSFGGVELRMDIGLVKYDSCCT